MVRASTLWERAERLAERMRADANAARSSGRLELWWCAGYEGSVGEVGEAVGAGVVRLRDADSLEHAGDMADALVLWATGEYGPGVLVVVDQYGTCLARFPSPGAEEQGEDTRSTSPSTFTIMSGAHVTRIAA